MATRNQERERLREERVAHQQGARQRSRRTLGAYLLAGLLSVALIAAVVAIVAGGSGGSSASAASFAQHYSGLSARREAAEVPTMMETMSNSSHFHPHLAVYVNGKRVEVPADIGIDPSQPSMQMAGLHTHDTSGTIHDEGMTSSRLGQFFAVWGVPFSAGRLGPYRAGGSKGVRMWVDGQPSRAFGALKLADGQQIVVSFGPKAAPPPPLDASGA